MKKEIIRMPAQSQKKDNFETLRFQEAADVYPEPMLLTNTKGIIQYVNPAWEKLTGFTADEAIGQKPHILKSGKTHKNIFLHIREALTTGKSYVTENIIDKRKDGTEYQIHATFFPILKNNIPVFYIQTMHDITKRLQLEKSLRESEEQLQALVDNAKGYAIYMLDQDGKIISWNRMAQQMSGYTQEEVLGKSVSLFYPKDAQKKKESQHALLIAKKTEKYEGELLRLRKDGTEYWASISISAIRNGKGKLLGFVHITHDISAIKHLEKQRDEFIGTASHELKTPITSLKIYTAILEKQIHEGHKKTIHILSRMSSQTNKLISLVDDLLNVDTIETGEVVVHKQEFAMGALVKKVVDTLQNALISHKLLIEGEITHKVFADEDRIEQVLISLITNAARFAQKGTDIVIHLMTSENRAIISVKDFGPGIEKKDQPYIFDKFYATGNKAGFGLGLFIASEIIKKHGEKIWVESKKGKGSTFYFTLAFA